MPSCEKKYSQDQFFCDAGMTSGVQKENEPRMYSIGELVGIGMLATKCKHLLIQ